MWPHAIYEHCCIQACICVISGNKFSKVNQFFILVKSTASCVAQRSDSFSILQKGDMYNGMLRRLGCRQNQAKV